MLFALVWQEVPPGVALKAVGASCAAAPARACAWAVAHWAAALRADAAAVQRVKVAHSDSVLVNQAPLAPDAAVAVGWRAIAAAHSAAAQLQPADSAEAAGRDVAALMEAQKAGSAAAHSAAAQLQPDGLAEAVGPGAAALKAAQKAGSVAAAHSAAGQLQADGSVEPAVPGAAALMMAQPAGFAAAGHSAAAELHLDDSVLRAVPGAFAPMEAQLAVAPPASAALAQEFRAPGRLESPLGYPDVAP